MGQEMTKRAGRMPRDEILLEAKTDAGVFAARTASGASKITREGSGTPDRQKKCNVYKYKGI